MRRQGAATARPPRPTRFTWSSSPTRPDAAELRYLRADILYFKLGDLRAAGHEYLAVGRAKPVGPQPQGGAAERHERVREAAPAAPAGAARRKRAVTDDDRRFAEAADLYATLFPNDKEIVTVIYKNGQFFYDHGDYDEAVKRFGLIIEQHPDSPAAGAAGDRLLECLGEAKDYENIEHWCAPPEEDQGLRRASDDQDRLDGLIAGALLKQGEELGRQGGLRAGGASLPRGWPRSSPATRAPPRR